MQDQFQTQKQTIISTAVPMQTRTYKPIAHEQLYQHTTFAMKEVHPSEWMGNHIKAHNFFKSMI